MYDTGDGIPAEEQDKLFTPFFRSQKHKKAKPGTGLGLAIVKRIVEAHGGSIRAESEEGKGTAFFLTFPFLRQEMREDRKEPKHRVLIIGGVTSGPRAASRLRRLQEDLEITVLEENEFLSYPGCELPAYIGSSTASLAQLVGGPADRVRNARFFHTLKNINVLNNTRALAIDREQRFIQAEDLEKGESRRIPYDTLIIAAGAEPDLPDIPGIEKQNVYSVYSLEEAKELRSLLSRNPSLEGVVIGGGLLGASFAESLLQMGVRMTILEEGEYILNAYLDRNMAEKLENLFSRKGIRILTGVDVTAIEDSDSALKVQTQNGSFHADFAICSTGVRPRSQLAEKAGLKIGPSGGISINGEFRTSDEHIFAIGDCAESSHLLSGEQEYWPLGSVSTKMGRMAADVIGGSSSGDFSGFLGTAMFQCFDLQVARTGLTAARARELGYPVETALISGSDKPEYKPGSGTVFMQICCNAENRRLLGVQAFGTGNVSAKVSMAAVCISAGMTLQEVYALDLGYSPNFTHPVDVLQTACAVAENKLDGLIVTAGREDVEHYRQKGTLLAVTPSPGSGRFLIPGSMEIPPEQIRSSGIPFDTDTDILLYCKNSVLAYQAYRYLRSNGYTAIKLLEGGYLFWEL